MKKVYLMLALFVTSFFFFSINEVSAATYTYELTEEKMAYINDDFFKLREQVIEYVATNNLEGYLIYQLGLKVSAFVFNSGYTLYVNNMYASNKVMLPLTYGNYTSINLDSNGNLSVGSTVTYSSTMNILSSSIVLDNYLDTDLPLTYHNSDIYEINYNGKTYTISKESTVPTMYQIYLDNQVPEEPVDKFLEEKEVMNNFYSTIFAKIGELAVVFANNFTFLFIFGMFILIFVIEIIRRFLI